MTHLDPKALEAGAKELANRLGFNAKAGVFIEHTEAARATISTYLAALPQAEVTLPTVAEIEAIIVATEPDIPASVDGERIWTTRMAKGLHTALTAALSQPHSEK